MSLNARIFIINNIKLPINASQKEAFSVAEKRLSLVGIDGNGKQFSIFKRSIDARQKSNVHFVYSVSVVLENIKISSERLKRYDIVSHEVCEGLNIEYGKERLSESPLIVGSGPCGLFAALILAENGYKPILIERGGSVYERKRSYEVFKTLHILDTETNIQFGAGGAGTFSDGKLVTRINDPLTDYVLNKFVEFGASDDIKYIAKPHIGTDVLSLIVDNIIARIIECGGEVYFHTKYLYSENVSGKSVAVTDKGNFPYSSLILALGHSARDTNNELIRRGFAIEAKPFSVGMRIEHKASDIDKALYGDFAGDPNLGHAEYNLSFNTKIRGVYTFCMCPGGIVVPAASETGGVVVNGMSYHARDGINSNSAVVCSVFKEDFGSDPRKAIDFQRKIEKAAFDFGGGDYSAPICTVGDFLNEKYVSEPTDILPSYMDSSHVRISPVEKYLPEFAAKGIRCALLDFDKKISGFAKSSAILTGAETRTSSPIRVLRDPETRLALGQTNIYPSGEGADYAGGITSAAIDGIRTALAIMKKARHIWADEIKTAPSLGCVIRA